MTDRLPAQTIGELDIHLSNVQSRLGELVASMSNMATKSDIEGIKLSMSTLATKAEVEAKVEALRLEVQRNKPGTLARQIVAIAAGLTVVASAVGLLVAVVRAFDGQGVQIAVKKSP
jgi:acyl CoA:acetate/3-ketoacid CoA transferase alpha subunit